MSLSGEEKGDTGERNEDLNRNGLAILDIGGSNNESVIKLGDLGVVDARKKITPQRPRGWIDPKEYERYGKVLTDIRKAFVSGEDMNVAFLLKMRELGFEVSEAKVTGKVPENWKPTSQKPRGFIIKG